jgi:hypothetical protein
MRYLYKCLTIVCFARDLFVSCNNFDFRYKKIYTFIACAPIVSGTSLTRRNIAAVSLLYYPEVFICISNVLLLLISLFITVFEILNYTILLLIVFVALHNY